MNAAREKVEREGRCRVCHGTRGLEAAHLWRRSQGASGFDNPDEIVPLCNALRGAGCHEAFDAGSLDLLGLLTVDEELAAVRLAFPISGRGSGIERARRVLAPTVYRRSPDGSAPEGTVFDG